MKIENIHWLSKEAKEAELKITDGTHSVTAFSQPCEHTEGQSIKGPLHIFMASNIMLTRENKVSITNNKNTTSFIVEKIKDLSKGLCTVGNIELEIEDAIPGGIVNGSLIEFECARVDLW